MTLVLYLLLVIYVPSQSLSCNFSKLTSYGDNTERTQPTWKGHKGSKPYSAFYGCECQWHLDEYNTYMSTSALDQNNYAKSTLACTVGQLTAAKLGSYVNTSYNPFA